MLRILLQMRAANARCFAAPMVRNTQRATKCAKPARKARRSMSHFKSGCNCCGTRSVRCTLQHGSSERAAGYG
eukprot:4171468-Lingulodinium_polyedra.AAC.1